MTPSIAILGGGPAGAFAGERLAQAGFPVTVIDEKLAWEKPCGGGLTAKALEQYPFLADSPAPKRFVHRAVLVASNGARATLRLRRPIAIYARQVLNGLLLDRARRAGASIVQDRVIRAEQRGAGWRLAGKHGEYAADFCVVATGARNPLRQMGTELGRRDAYVALGYYVPGSRDHLEIQFLHRFEGYLWIFPRPDHLSVGICGKLASGATAHLRRLVEDYMLQHDLPIEGSQFYCHVLPSLAPASFASNRVSGPGWAAAGDAAGLVDPLTGEGLYYALRSADLLAGCLREGCIAEYPGRLRADLMDDLQLGARLTKHLYHGRFLGGSVTTRMVQFTRRSPTFEALMQDLFAGSQTYFGLKARLLRQFGATLWEIASSFRHASEEAATQDRDAPPPPAPGRPAPPIAPSDFCADSPPPGGRMPVSAPKPRPAVQPVAAHRYATQSLVPNRPETALPPADSDAAATGWSADSLPADAAAPGGTVKPRDPLHPDAPCDGFPQVALNRPAAGLPPADGPLQMLSAEHAGAGRSSVAPGGESS